MPRPSTRCLLNPLWPLRGESAQQPLRQHLYDPRWLQQGPLAGKMAPSLHLANPALSSFTKNTHPNISTCCNLFSNKSTHLISTNPQTRFLFIIVIQTKRQNTYFQKFSYWQASLRTIIGTTISCHTTKPFNHMLMSRSPSALHTYWPEKQAAARSLKVHFHSYVSQVQDQTRSSI